MSTSVFRSVSVDRDSKWHSVDWDRFENAIFNSHCQAGVTSLSILFYPPFWVFTACTHPHTYAGYDRIALTVGDTPSFCKGWFYNSSKELSYQSLLKWARQLLGVVAWLQLLSSDFFLFSVSLSFLMCHSIYFLSVFILLPCICNVPKTATGRKLWTLSRSPPLPAYTTTPTYSLSATCPSVICISPGRGGFICFFFSSNLTSWLPGHRLQAFSSTPYYLL